jgi:aldehyde:ferredoxin oxidoreductase
VPQFFSAATGQEMTEDQYYSVGERSMNLQRAIMAREGRFGRENDIIAEFNFTEPIESEDGLVGLFNPDLEFPGKGEDVITCKGKTMDRNAFESMKDEYYELRKWDVNSGLQTEKCLEDLNLNFLSEELKKLSALK